MDIKTIEYRGMPMFHKVRFDTPLQMQGELQDYACLFYIVQGELASFDNRGKHLVGQKESIVKNCGRYVQFFSSEKQEYEAIMAFLYPDLLQQIYQDETPLFLQSNEIFQPKKIIGSQLLDKFMDGLSLYFDQPLAFDDELKKLKLKELIHILLKSEQHNSIHKLLSEIFQSDKPQL